MARADATGRPVPTISGKANMGHALEVAVHGELSRRGAEIAYVRTPAGFEVDSLSRGADGAGALIQVCADPDNSETLDREARALQVAAREHHVERQLILTAASRLPFPEVPHPIEILPAWQWMLEAEPD